ncbi:MAG: methylmalonyl-CoA mutase family protein [Anaerolineae bacterium]
MQQRFGAKDQRSLLMRYFNGGSGASLSYAEPLNNIIRGTLQCLTGVLAGAQACHVPSYDEAYTIPSEEAALLSVRTQQIIAHESNVTNVIDPLGGSYFVESLTNQLEAEIEALLRQIEESGGLVAAIERGELQRAIAERAYALQQQIQNGERVIVGATAFMARGEVAQIPAVPRRNPAILSNQLARLSQIKAERDSGQVKAALAALKVAAEGEANLMPPIIEAVRAYATVGEITGVLRAVFGSYQAPSAL